MTKALSLLRRHAAVAALLAVLAAAVAAPYLLPADPDSPVMRSGTLGAALLLACFFPVRRAFERHSLRALGFGVAFALIFAMCLGVGSELAFYERLLSGMGSLVRRLAVPVLAAPLLGALASYAFIPSLQSTTALRTPYLKYFLLFALCYGATLLAFFPGVVSYDFEHEIAQYQSGVFNAAHPVFHTLFLGAVYALGEALFGSMTAGAALYSVVQLLLMAAAYAAVTAFVQRRAGRVPALILAACFALLPFHGVLAVSTAKDPLFSALCALLCVQLWRLAEAPEAFMQSRRQKAAFALTSLGMALLRHNGLFAFLPACIALPFAVRRDRRGGALLCALTLALCLFIPRGMEALLHASKTPSSELMSVPCQQLARTAERAGLSEEEYAEINAWFSNATYRYRPHIADPTKGGNFDLARYEAHPGSFWRMYLRYGLAHPRIYLEAFLDNCAGLWNPDDTSHSHAMEGEDYDFIYLRTTYMYGDRYPIRIQSLFPALQNLLRRFTHSAQHEKYPFLAQLFCPAVYSFGLLLATMRLFFLRRRSFALATLPLWGIFLSLLFSAGILVRYAYPIMTAVPVLLALTFFVRAEE